MAWENWKKDVGGVAGGITGASSGGILGGIAGQKAGQRWESWGKGNIYGKTDPKRYGSDMPTPTLEDYQGIESLAGGGMLQARQVSGADIQKQMEESPWYKMALEKQGAEQAGLMDQASRQQAGALAGARSQLAMRGGLGGGAAERLASGGAENLSQMMQQQRQAGAVERGQLGMQGADLASRIGQFNVGQQSSTDVRNLQTQLANLAAMEDRKRLIYGEGMKSKGAAMTAQATENAGGGGLFGSLFGGK
jgi:hypothetical protein